MRRLMVVQALLLADRLEYRAVIGGEESGGEEVHCVINGALAQ